MISHSPPFRYKQYRESHDASSVGCASSIDVRMALTTEMIGMDPAWQKM